MGMKMQIGYGKSMNFGDIYNICKGAIGINQGINKKSLATL